VQQSFSLQALPAKVTVTKIVSSRYPNARRPESWDERKAGVDVIHAEEAGQLKLQSDGQQSPPREGWVIMLTDGNPSDGFRWTLYGMPAR
jgi:hypothetical protein